MNSVGETARAAVKRQAPLGALRWVFQTGFLLLLNPVGLYRLNGFCLPVLNCHGCPAAATACPILAAGRMVELGLFPFLVLGIFGLVAVLCGRLFCGWVCPFGFLQDLLAKLPVRRWSPPRWTRAIKYGLLVGMVPLAALLVGTDSRLFFCGICPAGTLEAGIPQLLLGTIDVINPVRTLFLGGFLFLMVFVNRGFCRIACPIGAALGLFNRFSLFRLRVDRAACIDCGACRRHCPTGEDPLREDNPENCVRCLECQRCPKDLVTLDLTPPVAAGGPERWKGEAGDER